MKEALQLAVMRRAVVVLCFVTVLLTVLVGGHLYLARRLILDPGVPSPARGVLLGVLAVLAASLVLQPFAERLLPRTSARWISWPASLWMGLAFCLINLLLLSDLTWVLMGAAVEGTGTGAARVRALGVLAVGLVAAGAGLRNATREPDLRRVEIELERWPRALDGYRIVQISDVHIGPLLDRRFARRVVERCNALAPDLIAVTGDLVDGSVRRVGAEVEPFAALRARHGAFFVTGNHDYYSGADAWVDRVRELGIRVLRNERVTIGEGEDVFDLAGVEDHHAHIVSAGRREDLDRALAGRDPARPVVLLAHDPATFPAALRRGVDLQLSGHTHGGQIWPFRYVVRLATPYIAGHYRTNGAQLYVSRGTGFWGPAVRLLAPAEITEITLRARRETA